MAKIWFFCGIWECEGICIFFILVQCVFECIVHIMCINALFPVHRFVWHLFTVFTVIHLYANYQAVLSLKMVTLNNARLILLLRMHLGMKIVSSPEVINRHEPVILGTGMSGNQTYKLQ